MVAITATDVELQKPINAILAQSFLRNARARCPYFVGTAPGQITEQGGSATIKWRRINTTADPGATGIGPSTSALAELTGNSSWMQGRTAAQAAFTDVVATIAKYGQFYILNEEVNLFTGWSQQNDQLMTTLGIVAGRSLNQLQRDIVEDNSTAVFANGVASDGAVLTSTATSDLDGVILTLNTNSAMTFTPMSMGSQNQGTAPILPAYWGICHPHVAADISKLSGFKSVTSYAGQVQTSRFEFGAYELAGQACRFLQTEDASINSGLGGTTGSTGLRGATNIDIYTIVIYGMDAIGSVGLNQSHVQREFMAGDDVPTIEMIVKERGSAGTGDPFNEISTMAYKFWHAGAVLNTNWSRALQVGSIAR